MMVCFCSALIFTAQDIVITKSRAALKNQTDIITLSLIKSAGATFEAQMKIGVSALLMPLANILRDANSRSAHFRNSPFPYSPMEHYFDPDLKPPVTTENDDTALNFPGIMARRFAKRNISKSASSNWLTNQFNGLAPDSPDANLFLNLSKSKNKEILDKTGYIDYFSPKMWELNPEFSTFYIGAPSKVTADSLFRAYPGNDLSPVFCGAMWDTPSFFKGKLYPALDDDLLVISNGSIKDVNLRGKRIETVDGVLVSSKVDVWRILDTTSNVKILVTWWQYDPKKRGWYSGAIKRAQRVMNDIDWSTKITKGVYFGGPYKGASNGVWMISASKAVFPQDKCKGGAPECGTKLSSLDLLGVSSFDMYISVLSTITSKIRSRDNGEGHLFHLESGLIVSSPQWAADSMSTSMKMADVFINTVKFGEENVGIVRSKDGGYFTFDDSIFSWVKVLDGRYAVIIQTPLEELYSSINKILDTIRSSTEKIFWELMIVCLLVSLVIGCFITLLGYVAVPLLRATGKEAERVVLNLGGDLFSGVEEDIHGSGTGFASRLGGLAEVTMLWTGFHSMLQTLAAKRLKKGNRDEFNPIFKDDELQMVLDGWSVPWQTEGCRLVVKGPAAKAHIRQELNQEIKEVHIPFWSSAIWRIMAFVGIPFAVGLGVALSLSTFTVRKNVDEWLYPIRKTLTDEERETLPIRLDAAAETLALLFRRHENSLQSYRDLVERTWNSASGLYPAGNLSEIKFSANAEKAIYPSFLGRTVTRDRWIIESLPASWPYSNSVPGGGHESTRVRGELRNYWASGWYGNVNNYSTSGWENPLLAANWSKWQTEQEIMSLADPFVREIFFANDLTDIYMGFEETESFRGYPLGDARWLATWEGFCLRDIPVNEWNSENLFKRSGYTPLCRGWYELARKLDGKVAYNGIDVSASNGLLYLAISVAVKDFKGKMFGVVAVEASLDELQVILSETIMVSGYLFLGDLDGSLIIHPQLPSTEEASIKEVEFACDSSFFEEVWDKIITLNAGMYEHNKCGVTNLIYWQLVSGTEYIAFLTVPLNDTEIPAEKVWEEVSTTIGVMVGLCVGLALPLGIVFLLIVAWMMSSSLKNLARTVNEIAVAPEKNIILPKSGFFHSSELVMILTNMKRLLAALRFGNLEWNKSKLDLELQNILELEEVMLKLQNHTGLGVVQNNHANILRQMAKGRKDEARELLSQAASLYKSAIENAKNVSGIQSVDCNTTLSNNLSIKMTNLNSVNTTSKVFSRQLGLAVVFMDLSLLETNQDQLDESLAIFESVIDEYDKVENWKGLATLGYLIACHEISRKSSSKFNTVVKNSISKSQNGLKKYVRFSGKLISSDYIAVCKLCYNIWWTGGEVNYLLWPLLNIPEIPKTLLYRLASEVLNVKSDKANACKNAQTAGDTGPCVEGEGERFAPGELVASAPPISVDTFGEREEMVINFSST